MAESIHENCGIAAVSLKDTPENRQKALFYLYRMLLSLQNRGQLAAGITTYNAARDQLLDTHKSIGQVNEVFRTSNRDESLKLFKRYSGSAGIGHVRYATCGPNEKRYAMPFERHHGRKWKWFAFAFNGNIANYKELKNKLLEKTDYHITLEGDTEIVMHYLSRELFGKKRPDFKKVFGNLAKKFDGSYNIVFIDAFGTVVAVRDPLGFRPLMYAIRNGDLFVASESNALLNLGIEDFKNVPPGTMIIKENGKIRLERYAPSPRRAHCMFEYVYFANVSSVLDDTSVYLTRTALGQELAKMETEKIDSNTVVIPVPDTAKAAGDAYAYGLGLPAMEGLIRNRYLGRTFIEGADRIDKVRNKYTVLRNIVEGKKVMLVDDSIVRGTTTKQLISYIKKVGRAKEVHVRVSCPPIRAPCFYGIDMSTIKELLVPRFERDYDGKRISEETCRKIAKEIGADSLKFQTVEGLIKAISKPKENLCMACINTRYPTSYGKKLFQKAKEHVKQSMKNSRTYESEEKV